jgi:hypothetical protein
MPLCLKVLKNHPSILMPNEMVSCSKSLNYIPTRRSIPLLYSSYTLNFHSFPNGFCSKMNMALNLMVHFGMLFVVWTTWVNGWFTPLFLRVVKVFYMALQINLLLPWTHFTQITHPLLPNFFLFFPPMNALFGYWVVGICNK